MTYYCMYKDECSFKDCTYRQTKSKFSTFNTNKDLTINGFTCNLTGKKETRLFSNKRIICNRYRECNINCLFKTIYITIDNFRKYFDYKFRSQMPFKCYDIGQTVILSPAGKNVENHAGNYTSIWNQPNLFTRKMS